MAPDPTAVRQAVLELLESGPSNEKQLLIELERRTEGGPVFAPVLAVLTHLSFTETQARRQWKRIEAHQEQLRLRLGRDVGLRVALLDYFVNVRPELHNPKVIELSDYEQTERSALTDGLTGLYNHAYLLQTLKREVNRSRRHRLALSLAMFDLDDFKLINDSRGHQEGDRVLVRSAALVRESLREIDLAARYGGEEFAVVLPETPRTGAFVVAERIRERVERHFARRKGGPKVTVSGGVATFPEDGDDLDGLIQKADQGLYRSKRAGKNRITLVQGERRRHPRVPAAHRVTVSGGRRRRSGRAINLSASGLLILLPEPPPVGSLLHFEVRRGQAPAMGLEGQVVRVRATSGQEAFYDVGVQLVGDATAQNLIALRGREIQA